MYLGWGEIIACSEEVIYTMHEDVLTNHKNFGEDFNFLTHVQIPFEYIVDIHTIEALEDVDQEEELEEKDIFLLYEFQKK